MCDIPLDISRNEFDRRMRVFGGNHFGMAPSIKLHGVEFRAVIPASFAVKALHLLRPDFAPANASIGKATCERF